jgi:uncharacterized membrane protein (DUF2068 family)
VRIVAAIEAAKGAVVLATGLGLLELVHRDAHAVGEQVVRHLHLNPARHYPRIFLDALSHVTEGQYLSLAAAAFLYALARLAEGWGLWFHRRWAEWFGLVGAAVYLPVELYGLWRGVTAIKAVIFVANALVVLVLGRALLASGGAGRR